MKKLVGSVIYTFDELDKMIRGFAEFPDTKAERVEKAIALYERFGIVKRHKDKIEVKLYP